MNRERITRKTSERSTIATHHRGLPKVEIGMHASSQSPIWGTTDGKTSAKLLHEPSKSCDNSGVSVESHFRDTTRDLLGLASASTRSIADVKLTR